MNYDDFMIPIVLLGCLITGYILKNWIKDLDNKYIPTILTILGAILACVYVWDITLEHVIYGALTGLGSTGMHQMFKQYIERGDDKDAKRKS